MSRSCVERFKSYLATERNASEHTVEAYTSDIADFGERIRGDAEFDAVQNEFNERYWNR